MAPDYPRFCRDEAALVRVDPKRRCSPLAREVSLPSMEMLVEDAQMRWARLRPRARATGTT